MKTVGETLKSVREKHAISLDQLSAQTHIKKEYLVAIESGEFSVIPSPAVVQGFISSYAQILGVEPKTVLALLRRDYDVTRSHILPKHLVDPTSKHTRKVKKGWYSATVFVACLLVVGIYVLWNYIHLHQPPSLKVTAPKDGTSVSTDVVVRGVTDSDATVQIDTQPVALTQDGEFAQDVTLSPGDHTITVIAANRAKQETIEQVVVHVQN